MARALRVVKGEGASLVDIPDAEIGKGEVTIDVAWSSLNYKDSLALAGRPGIVRADRLIAGIDLVGAVSASESPDWVVGDRVLVNGCGLGETHDGGLSEVARVHADWLVRVPDRFSPPQAAAVGTAGYTAALAVLALEAHGAMPGDDAEVLVTGATGGVGGIAILLLAAAGYRVAAATGKTDKHDLLRGLGATTIVDRSELDAAGKPLQSERWAGVVDTIGGPVLASAIAQTRYDGTVAACGNAQSIELSTTVLPFILRGVTLAGINSVLTPRARRLAAWERLDRDLNLSALDELTASIGLGDAIAAADRMLAGETTGRTIVDVRR